MENESLQRDEAQFFSITILLNHPVNGILSLFRGSSILLVLFLNPFMFYSLARMPTNIVVRQGKLNCDLISEWKVFQATIISVELSVGWGHGDISVTVFTVYQCSVMVT